MLIFNTHEYYKIKSLSSIFTIHFTFPNTRISWCTYNYAAAMVVKGALWESANCWPLLSPGGEWHPFMGDSLIFAHGKRGWNRGGYPFSLLGSDGVPGCQMAFRIAS